MWPPLATLGTRAKETDNSCPLREETAPQRRRRREQNREKREQKAKIRKEKEAAKAKKRKEAEEKLKKTGEMRTKNQPKILGWITKKVGRSQRTPKGGRKGVG